MKKINLFIMAALTAMLSFSFTACSNDDDDNNAKESNYDKALSAVQSVVNETKASSKHTTAMLLVTFGSTWQAPHDTYKGVQEQFAKAFPDADVYLAFTSSICISRCAAGENTDPVNYYAPSYWLKAIGMAQYSTVCVQSLHCIPGEEFLRMRDTYVKDFHNDTDLPEAYRSSVKVYVGGPLMADEADVNALATVLNKHFSSVAAKGVMAFMGHGNPESYNYGNGNIRYSQLEAALQKINKNYYVGTVDMKDNYVDNVIGRMHTAGFKTGAVELHPLMSIAGDHANNDMKGGVGETAKDGSWRSEMTKAGYTCPLNNCILKGLGDYTDVVDIWISHMKNALAEAPMYPEAD